MIFSMWLYYLIGQMKMFLLRTDYLHFVRVKLNILGKVESDKLKQKLNEEKLFLSTLTG